MKFKELDNIETQRNRTFQKFHDELEEFKLQYPEAEFDLQYADREHLMVITESVADYNKEIHESLCSYFNVKLTYVNRLNQQSARGHYLTIEYIYQNMDAAEEQIPWESIRV